MDSLFQSLASANFFSKNLIFTLLIINGVEEVQNGYKKVGLVHAFIQMFFCVEIKTIESA
jgi:hypothetical protein